ncbi:uncharacterized protein LOC141924256 isoform X2 [Strix aluco]|uniref:uncharacterized protein LOC141924256 isoform X2 n=1 Tax=Strix aluco TaxID=111821 RepID=UPI003DA45614
MDTWARPRGGTYYNEFCGNGWTFRGNSENWGYKRVAYSSPGYPGLRHLLLGPETPAAVGAPPPTSRLSRRIIAGFLVVAEEASDTDAATEGVKQAQTLM